MAANNNPKVSGGLSGAAAAGGEHIGKPGDETQGGAKLDPAISSNTRMTAVDPVDPQVAVRK